MKKKIPITEFAGLMGPARTARLLGVTTSAVSQMVSDGRDIYIEEYEDGKYRAFEVRPVPTRRKRAG